MENKINPWSHRPMKTINLRYVKKNKSNKKSNLPPLPKAEQQQLANEKLELKKEVLLDKRTKHYDDVEQSALNLKWGELKIQQKDKSLIKAPNTNIVNDLVKSKDTQMPAQVVNNVVKSKETQMPEICPPKEYTPNPLEGKEVLKCEVKPSSVIPQIPQLKPRFMNESTQTKTPMDTNLLYKELMRFSCTNMLMIGVFVFFVLAIILLYILYHNEKRSLEIKYSKEQNRTIFEELQHFLYIILHKR